jgi:integrator complex subunit 7
VIPDLAVHMIVSNLFRYLAIHTCYILIVTPWQVKAALFAAGCFCKLSEDFSRITLQVLAGLVTSPTSEAQVVVAAIKTFSKLDCTLAIIRRVREVGKEMVLGNLEDVFKAEMLFALSRLASKSIVFFSDQVM